MEKTREWYKEAGKKPFTMEYLWRELKDQTKWFRTKMDHDKNKRTNIFEYGAYTSSCNQVTEDVDINKQRPLEGRKVEKGRRKGKEKCTPQSSVGNQPCENMIPFHDAIAKRKAALEKQQKPQRRRQS